MDDLIRRRGVIAALGERPLVWVGSDYELGARNQYDCDRLAVETTPTVDAVPVRHGTWKTVEDWDGDEHYQCSECGAEFVFDGTPSDNDYLYCPHCGAKMDGDKNEID